MQLLYNSVFNPHKSVLTLCTVYLFPSDSVFEDEGAETPPTAAQSAEEGDKPKSSPNPAESDATEGEEGETQSAQMHGGTGRMCLSSLCFMLSSLFCFLSLLVLINVSTLVCNHVFPLWILT